MLKRLCKYVFLAAFTSMSPRVMAKDIQVQKSRATVPINSLSGTSLEFPKAIRSIEKTSKFYVREIVKKVDPKTKRPMDIRSIHIRPKTENATDTLTIIFSGGKRIYLSLKAEKSADGYHRIHIRPIQKSEHVLDIAKYLDPKLELMKAMISENYGTKYQTFEHSDSIDMGLLDETLSFELTQSVVGQSVEGYVIHITNDDTKPIKLNPNWFSGFNDKVVSLVHLEKSELSSCSFWEKMKSYAPCKTLAKVVVTERIKENTRKNDELPFLIGAPKR